FAEALRIDRRVEVYRLGETVLRLEWYPEMDVLLEVEGEPAGIERAIAATGIAREHFLAESLPHFVARSSRRSSSGTHGSSRRRGTSRRPSEDASSGTRNGIGIFTPGLIVPAGRRGLEEPWVPLDDLRED